MVCPRLISGFIACSLWAGTPVFPLKDIRAGMRGVGRTVFSGSQVEDFQVEILGVLENLGPRQSVILARLSGGPLEKAGVLQGMSGSPVYIDGKLVGAVALAFAFAKEPIAGIRPFEEMLRAGSAANERRAEFFQGDARLVEIATPVSFSGFTAAAIEHFAPQLRELGLDPRQGVSAGGRPPDRLGDPRTLKPGSMISVQLLCGDLSVGADGTVTHIDGNRMWAFGHRVLATGATELPFARAEVLTILPNLSSSFKIAAAREWMGAITEDRSTAVAGVLGRRAATVPLAIAVNSRAYHMQMANDRVISPLLVQMALYSAIDATERVLGGATISVRGQIEFKGAPPVRVDNVYTGDVNVPLQAAVGAATPLAYALQSGFDALMLKSIALNVGGVDRKKQLVVDQVWVPHQARPGDDIELTVTLVGDNGVELARKTHYHVPVGAPHGPLYFTVADGTTTNLAEFQQTLGVPPASPQQVVEFLNSLRGNTKAYLRVWRGDPGYQARGQDLPGLPPSAALLFARSQASSWRGSKVAEMEIAAADGVVTGSKTAQVEIKE